MAYSISNMFNSIDKNWNAIWNVALNQCNLKDKLHGIKCPKYFYNYNLWAKEEDWGLT